MGRFLAFFCVFLTAPTLIRGADFTGPSFAMPLVTVGGAGGVSFSPSFSLAATASQPSAIGFASGPTFSLKSGFFAQFFSVSGPPSFISQVVPTDQDVTIVIAGPGGFITVTILAGTFSDVVTLTVSVPSAYPPLRSNIATLTGTGIGVEIVANPPLAPQKPITVNLTYRDSDIQGLQENQLRTAHHLGHEGLWVPLESTVNFSGNDITIREARIGIFQVAQMAPGATVDHPFVYPNPFRPALGHTHMRISNIPSDSRVVILTLRGYLVRELTPDNAGRVDWDGKNRDGENVASGIYLAHVRLGSSYENIKIAVQR